MVSRPIVPSNANDVNDNLPFEPARASLAGLQEGLQKLCRHGAQVPVEILHLGDSHTAGDIFSGHLRNLFQREFGAGGRGMLPAGVPFKWYQPQQLKVSRAKTANWKHQNSFKRKHQGPFGVTGFRAIGNQANQRVVLSARKRQPFEMFKLEVRTLAQGGGLNVKVGDAPVAQLSTRRGDNSSTASKKLQHWIEPLRDEDGKALPYVEHTFYYRDGADRVEVWPVGDGPVELLSWSVRRGVPGVLYHSQGVVGATAEIIRRWDSALVDAELKRMQPDLILLAYGTNEGFNDGLKISRYERSVELALKQLQAGASKASIAILAPPDSARIPRYCGKAVRKQASCKSLSASERRNYRKMLRNKDRTLCRWHAPPKLAAVRSALQRIATRNDVFYWDWSAVMGGQCGTDEWTRQRPKLAHGDRVHLTNRGYRRSADDLYAKLRGTVRCDLDKRRLTKRKTS